MKRVIFASVFVVLLFLFLAAVGSWVVGNSLTMSVPEKIGNCPIDLICENVEFPSESGSEIKGWFIKGRNGQGVVVLMHGLRANRFSLVERIRFLRNAGFSVLAFDFQGSGESDGKQITFGFVESKDAEASLKYVKQKLPDEKIGVIGISMGGASFLLQDEAQQADAIILERSIHLYEKQLKTG